MSDFIDREVLSSEAVGVDKKIILLLNKTLFLIISVFIYLHVFIYLRFASLLFCVYLLNIVEYIIDYFVALFGCS